MYFKYVDLEQFGILLLKSKKQPKGEKKRILKNSKLLKQDFFNFILSGINQIFIYHIASF